MPKQSPIPNELDLPFYEAANEHRLVLQYCSTDDRWQYPPEPVCYACGSADNLSWRQTDGGGTVYSFGVVYDTPIATLQPNQPFNCAVISLRSCPGINFLSHLPGTPPGQVQIGAEVRLVFESTPGTGQNLPEWQVVAATGAE